MLADPIALLLILIVLWIIGVPAFILAIIALIFFLDVGWRYNSYNRNRPPRF